MDSSFITDLCENKIAVHCDVQTEMDPLRSEGQLSFSETPVSNASQIGFKLLMHFLNARSLQRHIEDVCKDLNYSTTDVNINFFQRQDFVNLTELSFLLAFWFVKLII